MAPNPANPVSPRPVKRRKLKSGPVSLDELRQRMPPTKKKNKPSVDDLRQRVLEFAVAEIPAVTRAPREKQPNPYEMQVTELAAQMEISDDVRVGTSKEARCVEVPLDEVAKHYQLLYEAGDRVDPPVTVRKWAEDLDDTVRIIFWTTEKIRRPGRRSDGNPNGPPDGILYIEA